MSADGSEPLTNQRWERFALAYSTKCFGMAGRAYSEATGRSKSKGSARTMGSRLLLNVDVLRRVRHLRREVMATLAIDAVSIAEERLQIATSPTASFADKLTALRDLERSLGFLRPDVPTVSTVSIVFSTDPPGQGTFSTHPGGELATLAPRV